MGRSKPMNVTVDEFISMFNTLVPTDVGFNYPELSEFLMKISVFESFFAFITIEFGGILKYLILEKLSGEYTFYLSKPSTCIRCVN